MLEYFMKIMGLSPSPEELEFSKRMENSWKSIRVGGKGGVSVDIDEIRADQEYMDSVKELLWKMNVRATPAEQAINILRGSRITQKEADELIEIIKCATI